MSSPSMASPTITYSQSPLTNTKLSLTLSTSLLPTTNFFFPPKSSFKPFKLQLFTIITKPSTPLPLLHRTLAYAFDSLEVTQDDPQPEPSENEQEQEGNNEEEEEEEQVESTGEGRLYVGNLPYSMNSSELREIFEEAGRVANVEVIYDRVTDRSRGFGFVTMASVEEAEEAIRLFNGAQIGGRTARVNFPEVPKGGEKEVVRTRIHDSNTGFVDSLYKIYAGNLGWRVTSQGLRDAFADQKGLLSVKVIYERSTGRSRGFGFVSFESAEDAEAALEVMNGVEVEGRPLRLNMAGDRGSSPPTS